MELCLSKDVLQHLLVTILGFLWRKLRKRTESNTLYPEFTNTGIACCLTPFVIYIEMCTIEGKKNSAL
jgi:hypothetical protein